ncbi:cation:proton antiporter [Methanoplanus endosymbiosus]|uniref:Sodium:proton antiporter n=1 Tax=Methanoplanus endosymbiosus TaxID=33865 RepID=A0A9E7PPU9_9EURY|nr:sodium:proton antiporter [Methanoplanus endosymbiosus]UUX92661.1 sodium:proton antiporter [Methanoplanus endosymbiosus]
MIGTEIEGIIALILFLLIIAVVSGILFRRIKIPYTIGLFLIGLGISTISSGISEIEQIFDFVLSPEVILFLFLPPLVFEAAYHINKRLMARKIVPILVLAIPGLIFSTLIVGYIIGFMTPVPIVYAMLFGALISATDPVSVIGLFRNMGAPAGLTTILEGESLFNDASAIVTFNIVLGIIAAGTFNISTIIYGAEGIIWSFSGGIITGIISGFLIGGLIALSEKSAVVSSVISVVTAYASYLIAESVFHASGIIAVVTAGLIVGRFTSVWLKSEDSKEISEFQYFSAYLVNSLIFLLMGITTANLLVNSQIDRELLILIPAGIIAVFISRAAVIYIFSGIMNLFKGEDYIPLKYQHALFWGGLRGAVAIALALSISEDMPFKDEIVIMAVGVVLFTIIVDGITTKPLAKKLGLDRPSNLAVYEYFSTVIHAKKEGLTALDSLLKNRRIDRGIADKIRADYEDEIKEAMAELKDLFSEVRSEENKLKKLLWIRLIMVERSIYEEIYGYGYISEVVLDELRYYINMKLDEVSAGTVPPHELIQSDSIEYSIFITPAWWISALFNRFKFAKNLRKFALTTEYQKQIAMISSARQMEFSVDMITAEFGFPDEIILEAKDEFRKISGRAEKIIEDMAMRYPELSEDIEDYYLRLSLLIQDEDYYEEMKNKGLIFPNVYEDLLKRVDKERKNLEDHIFKIV